MGGGGGAEEVRRFLQIDLSFLNCWSVCAAAE